MLAGILTLIFSTLSFVYSFYLFKKGKYTFALEFLLLGGLILRIFSGSDLFVHEWDERYHALVAKNLIQNPFKPLLYKETILPYDYKSWIANHIWLHKQPLSLWTISLSLFLFGVNEFALRLPSIILSTIGIFFTFRIAEYVSNKKVAYISAFLYAINGLIIETTTGRVATDHIDTFFMFFIQGAIFFSIKSNVNKKNYWNILVGLFLGLAILSKSFVALIVLPVWVLLNIEELKDLFTRRILLNLLVIVLTAIVVAMPWQIFIHFAYPLESAWESSLNWRHLTEVIEDRGGTVFYFLNKIRVNYGELIYLPLLYYIVIQIKKPNLKSTAILLWFAIPFVFFSLCATKMQGYLLFAAPALFIMTGDFLFKMLEQTTYKINKIVLRIVALALIVLPIRYTVERLKPFEDQSKNVSWRNELKAIDREYKEGVLFNYPKPIEAMFYTNLIVYDNFPDIETIKGIIATNKPVFIYGSDSLTNHYKNIKGVTLIKPI